MTRFLRFELGGASALIWMLLFLSPYLNIGPLLQVDSVKVLSLVFGSITLSIPLGNYIHQFTDALCNPFARRRLFFWPRAVIPYVRAHLQDGGASFRDTTFQAVLVFSKAYSRTSKSSASRGTKANVGHTRETDSELKVDILREEIANRYSYYYARIENGAIAPGFGALFAWLLLELFGSTNYIHEAPSFSPMWIWAVGAIGAAVILGRIPQLFRELDDLEISLTRVQRDIWPMLDA